MLIKSMARKFGIPGLSFSWKRAVGISAFKSKISRSIGIPLTRSGRQRKVGKALGCCIPATFFLLGTFGTIVGTSKIVSALFS